ncbi:uncharacterized protein RJT20DRAFT_10470 [Scheffersomyces xylosifermentans]|uniref:uncharacterized protein n=1 Tax=Scheffersomyces xylosifermentans TaxID=1304137 RepID=UPI00315D310B
MPPPSSPNLSGEQTPEEIAIVSGNPNEEAGSNTETISRNAEAANNASTSSSSNTTTARPLLHPPLAGHTYRYLNYISTLGGSTNEGNNTIAESPPGRNQGTMLNSINVFSDYIYRATRDLEPTNSTTENTNNNASATSNLSDRSSSGSSTVVSPEATFRTRIMSHLNDVNRLQSNYNRLMEDVSSRITSNSNDMDGYRDSYNAANVTNFEDNMELLDPLLQTELEYLHIRHIHREITEDQYRRQEAAIRERERSRRLSRAEMLTQAQRESTSRTRTDESTIFTPSDTTIGQARMVSLNREVREIRSRFDRGDITAAEFSTGMDTIRQVYLGTNLDANAADSMVAIGERRNYINSGNSESSRVHANNLPNLAVNNIPEQLRNLDNNSNSNPTSNANSNTISSLFSNAVSSPTANINDNYRLIEEPTVSDGLLDETDMAYSGEDDDDDADDDDEEFMDDGYDENDEEDNDDVNEDDYLLGFPIRARNRTHMYQRQPPGVGDEGSSDEDDEDSLRSDIQSNERLLLSSARQNYTNMNTLVSARGRPIDLYLNLDNDETTIDSGIPLRRQNAIRIRPRSSQEESETNLQGSTTEANKKRKTSDRIKELLNHEARVLQRDISKILRGIKAMKNFHGESPLFTRSAEDNNRNFSNLFFSKLSAYPSEDVFPNLEIFMDKYLLKRRHNWLWLESNGSANTVTTKGIKRKSRRNSCATSSRSSPSSPISTTNKHKRQKVKAVEDEEAARYSKGKSTSGTKYEHNIRISRAEKESIMNVQFCSTFQSGSCFKLSASGGRDEDCDLVFSNVDYENKKVFGLFNIHHAGGGPLIYLLRLERFAHYLCGFNVHSNYLPKNPNLLRKLNLLDRLDKDERVKTFTNKSVLTSSSMNVPFEGNIIDFKINDLRFLSNPKPADNMVFRNSSASKLKSTRIRLQLSEWMRLQPFVQFKESYFLAFLSELNKNLLRFSRSKVPRMQKSEALHMTKEFRSNIYELTKDFPWDEDAAIPVLEEQRAARQFGARNYRDFFLEDWERTLAHRLSEQLTRDDSASLVNIQLNYILFTMKIDISAYLDNFIKFYFENSIMEQNVKEAYQKVIDQISEDEKYQNLTESQSTTLICSLNRKTGELEIHNTLPYLQYKDVLSKRSLSVVSVHSTRHSMNDIIRTQLIRDDRELFSTEPESVPNNLNAFIGRRESFRNPYDEFVETKLYGRFKKDLWEYGIGGGNPSYSVV